MRFHARPAAAAPSQAAAAEPGPNQEVHMSPDASPGGTTPARPRLPFHAQLEWTLVQVPIPRGRCSKPLPEGMSFLWLTRLGGTAVSTYLGRGPIQGSLCIYGRLTDPAADPPGNGIPAGWCNGAIVLTSEEGEELHLEAWSTGFTAPPGTPGWQFTEEGVFVGGGTGRFRHAEGEFTAVVDPVAQTGVYAGWIRFGE